jgi:RTX calcium-binding nonapeptide repeat (4 copies)
MRNLIHNANNIHDRRSRLKTGVNLRRVAGTLAVMATAVGGLSAFATPAGAATGPTATLNQGIVTVTGTAARDVIGITIDASRLTVDFGFDGTVDAQFRRSRIQRVRVLAAGGDDGVVVEGSGVGDVPITMRGQGGNDFLGLLGNIGDFGDGDLAVTMIGADGNDDFLAAAPGPVTIQAGAGDDRVDGGGAGTGRETVSLGDGNDKFVSQLTDFVVGGTRSDIVDGGAGQDTMDMEGSFATESIGLSANAGHLIVDHELRDRIDADNIEDVSWRGFGGLDESGSGDAVAVNDLSGTDVVHFTPDFTDPLDGAGPNNSSDTLTVRGTAGVDHITVSGSGADITVAGLVPLVTPVNLAPDDFLRIDTLDGRDTVDRSGLQAGLVQLLVF